MTGRHISSQLHTWAVIMRTPSMISVNVPLYFTDESVTRLSHFFWCSLCSFLRKLNTRLHRAKTTIYLCESFTTSNKSVEKHISHYLDEYWDAVITLYYYYLLKKRILFGWSIHVCILICSYCRVCFLVSFHFWSLFSEFLVEEDAL